jgi:AcrR family transcriptional regulator
MSTATPTRKKKAPVRAKKTSVRPAPWDSPRRSGREPSFIEEARRKQILDVSLQLIAQRGYDSTSLADIAEAVGVSKGVISYHFDGKSDLGKQVLRHWMRQYNRYVTERLDRHASYRAKLLELPSAAIDFAAERHAEALIYLDTVGCFGTTEERHLFLAWAEAGMRDYILDVIRKARAAGEIGEVDEGPLADLIQAMADGVTGLWGMDPKAVDLDGCKKLIQQMLLSVIGGKR